MAPAEKNSTEYTFRNIQLTAHERIIGFEIDVSGGGFESISALPKGWRIAIDNKSASRTQVNADLAYGSEAITEKELKGIVVTLSQSERPGHPFSVSGYLLVNNLSSDRRIFLSSQNFLPNS